MRWSIGRCSSPRQYAPATFVSLNAPSRFVDGTCGPRHRSTNSPSWARVSVHRDHGALADLGPRLDPLDDLELVRLVGEQGERLVATELLAHERLVGLDDLAHAGLDALEVVVAEVARRPGSSKS